MEVLVLVLVMFHYSALLAGVHAPLRETRKPSAPRHQNRAVGPAFRISPDKALQFRGDAYDVILCDGDGDGFSLVQLTLQNYTLCPDDPPKRHLAGNN